MLNSYEGWESKKDPICFGNASYTKTFFSFEHEPNIRILYFYS